MSPQRAVGRPREHGSWLPKAAGFGVVVLAVAGGVGAYLASAKSPAIRTSPATAVRHVPKVIRARSAGMVNPGTRPDAGRTDGPPDTDDSGPRQLLASGTTLTFAAVPAAEKAAGHPAWTIDQMAGGFEVLIDIATRQCLTAKPGSSAPLMSRCALSADQRWQPFISGKFLGQPYSSLRNVATGTCLSAGPHGSAAAYLAPCGPRGTWRQRIAFWWSA